jgi:D-galactonate transporter
MTESTVPAIKALPSTITTSDEEVLYRKVSWRLLPFLMLCYLVAYLDRVNVGFAKLQMLGDLRFSETIYGLGAGMFFIGYFFFEVPSNLMLHRLGARIWIGRIMISWGLVSAAFMFVRTPAMFYSLRFLLGIAEAGFFPGIILYLTYWFPSDRRARMITVFMTGIPIAGVIGAPLSGWIMQRFAGVNGWAGWQWLFVLEAIPALILGVVVMFYLDDGIRSARWLTTQEQEILERNIERDRATTFAHPSWAAVFSDGRMWWMCAIYFCCVIGQYGLTFWLPTLVQGAGVRGPLMIGVLTAVPYSAAVVAMLLSGRSADRRRERRWHYAVPSFVGAAALSMSALAGTHTGLAMLALTIAAMGILSTGPLFWSLPTAFLQGAAAAAGIAAINSIGNLAGFVSPYVVGWLKDTTHSTEAGMYVVSGAIIVGALTALAVPARLVNR